MASQEAEESAKKYFDGNNNLSSAGAAASMRYARPNELPSYPSTGLPHREERGQDATTAATLGWQNQKPVEIYRPAPSSSAATAANLGWKSKAPEHWKPEQSMNGARAAVLASQRDKGKASVPPPPPSPKQPASTQKQRPDTSSWGNSAANIAVANSKRPKTANPQPTVTQAIKEKQRPKSSGWGNSAANIAVANSKRPETPPSQSTLRKDAINRHGSMRAATGAMTTPVQRPSSAPGSRPSYPDAANARANALRAAAHADNASKRPKPAGGATPAVSMPRGKFTSHPTTDAQVDEKTKQDQMQASAVAMAKLMYKNMQKTEQDPTSKAGASAATGRHGRSLSLSSAESNQPPPMRFNNIHDQATRLAAERVAAMHDEEAEARDLRAYYGLQPPPQPQRRFSVGKLFKKKPDSDDELSDDEGSRRIRQQMSLFQSRLSQVDNRKQMSDREALMAAAQRKVQKDLADIDQQVYQKTGKVTPQMQADWDAKARAAAEAESQRRMEHFGQVDIGGGQYMEQEDLNAIAQRNIEPHMIAADNQAQQMILERDLKKQKKLDKKEFKADQKAMKKMDKAEAARQVERNKFQAKETEMVKKQIVANKEHSDINQGITNHIDQYRPTVRDRERLDEERDALMTGARGEPAGPHRADRLNTKTQSHPRDWELQHMSQDDVAYHHRYINQDAADPAYNDPKTKGPDRWGSTNKRSKRDSIKAFIGRLTGGGSSDDDELDPDKKGKGEDKGKKRETMVPGANPRDSSPSRDSFIAGPAYHKLVNSEAGGPADYGEPIEPISPIDERGPITPTREQDDSTVSIMSNESMERRRKEAQEDMASPDGEAGPSGSSKPMFPPARDPSPVSSERRASKFRESL